MTREERCPGAGEPAGAFEGSRGGAPAPTGPGGTIFPSTVAAQPALSREPIAYPSGGLKITGLLSKPEGAGPFPLILVNHAGFDPARTVGPLLDLFAKLGYVALASDYRGVAGSEGKPEVARGEVDDVLNAIAYARTLPYVDGNRVVAWGHSHGGAIALFAAARCPEIQAVVSLATPIELADCFKHWLHNVHREPTFFSLMGIQPIIGGRPDQVPEAWRQRSPLYAADRIRCPVLLIQGGKDRTIPPDQAGRMGQALRANGNNDVTVVFDPETGHELDAAAYKRLGKVMIAFLNRHAGVGKAPR